MNEREPKPIVLIDDEEHIRASWRQTLELAGYTVTCLAEAKAALPHLSPDWPGVVISDIKMPGMDGMAFLRAAQKRDPALPVVLVTGHGDIAMAVQAIRDGAYDFVEKPCPADRLVDVVNRAMEKRGLVLENRALRDRLSAHDADGPAIIGQAPTMARLRDVIANVADTDADVLVVGETGTGKELVARALHEQGRWRHGRFVALNCGAMPESIFESELFGHEKGTFTGAETARVGKLEYAAGGTLFLDEIESMPLALQVKLLRVLQERTFERLGGNDSRPVTLRVVAATKIDLREAANAGTFREDLYYRLNVVVIPIPPLRDRREDVPLLFQHFVARAATRFGRETPPPLPHRHTHALMTHDWPGNVRELRNVAERYVLDPEGGLLDGARSLEPPTADAPDASSLPAQVAAFEKSLIAEALRLAGGNVTEATDLLGVPRKTLYDKLKKYRIGRTDFQ